MTHHTEPNHLDDLLARSAPPSAGADADLTDAVASVIAQARTAAPRRGRFHWTKRSLVVAVGSAVVLTGGALVGNATGALRSQAWMGWNPEVLDNASIVKWQVVNPDGKTCVDEIVAIGMSDKDFATAVEILRHPDALIQFDAGKTRDYFLSREEWPGVDKDKVIDQAYAAVEHMDVDTGQGTIREEDLGYWSGSTSDEVFFRVETRLVLFTLEDMLAAQGIDTEHKFTPDTACVVTP